MWITLGRLATRIIHFYSPNCGQAGYPVVLLNGAAVRSFVNGRLVTYTGNAGTFVYHAWRLPGQTCVFLLELYPAPAGALRCVIMAGRCATGAGVHWEWNL